MTRWGVLLLAMTSTFAWARSPSYSIHIGNNAAPAGSTDVGTLRFSDDDAVRMYELMSQFTDRSVLLTVLDAESQRRFPSAAGQARPPSSAELKREVMSLAERIEADVARGDTPVVYVSFSGHGTRTSDGSFFLALENGQLGQRQLYDEVLTPLQSATVHLFIDACHAEALVSARDGSVREATMERVAVRPSDVSGAFEARLPDRFPRVGILAATATEQQAHEWSRIESGVFTYEVLSGLSGAADVNHDDVVEYSELAAFIASANREFSDPRAIPSVLALPPRANVHAPLVRLGDFRRMGTLEGTFDVGHFFVELENGLRAIDAHFGAGGQGKVRLPPGRAYVVAGDREAMVTVEAGRTIHVDALRLAPRSSAPRGSVEAALNAAFFKAPFSRDYYQGYVDSRREPSVAFGVTASTAPESGITRRGWAWITSGSAVVLLGSTIAFGVVAGNHYRTYLDTSLQRPAADALVQTNTFLALSIVSGVATAALGVASWRLWTADLSVAMAPLTQGAVLSLSGKF